LRDGREQSFMVKLAERPIRDQTGQTAPTSGAPAGERPRPDDDTVLGLTVRDLDRGASDRLDLPRQMKGVLITRVEPLTGAVDADVQRGSVLLKINRKAIGSAPESRRIARASRPGDVLALYVYVPDLDQRKLLTVRVDER